MVLGTFAAHLVAIQGAQQIPDLEADGAKPAFAQAYGALVLCTAGVSLCIIFLVHYILIYSVHQVQHALLLYRSETITLEMIQTTGKAPTRLPKTLNQSTGKYSTWATGFNDVSCGELTHTLLKLITVVLRPESYDKIVVGAKAITAKTRRATHTDNVIDLTADEPPAEFAMLVDNLSDDEDRDDKGKVRFEGNDSIKVEGDNNIKIKGKEDAEFENEEYNNQDDQEQGVMEEEYEELDNSAAEDLEDDEDEDDEDD